MIVLWEPPGEVATPLDLLAGWFPDDPDAFPCADLSAPCFERRRVAVAACSELAEAMRRNWDYRTFLPAAGFPSVGRPPELLPLVAQVKAAADAAFAEHGDVALAAVAEAEAYDAAMAALHAGRAVIDAKGRILALPGPAGGAPDA